MVPVAMKAPVQCACSNSQNHTTNHIECRCDGQFRKNNGLRYEYNSEEALFPKNCRDEEGFLLCEFCGKVRNTKGYEQLVQCPDCGVWFKGYRRYPKVDYECEDCM